MVRVFVVVLIMVLLAYSAWLTLLYVNQRRLLFSGATMAVPATAGLPVGAERRWLDVAGDKVEAWLLPANPDATRPAPAVIFAHGNGEFIDGVAGQFGPLRAAGLDVLLVEYPGYGRSGGDATQTSVTATFVAAYDWLAHRPQVDSGRIVGMSRSLGGGVIAALSRKRHLAAVVMQSAFASVAALARDYGAPAALVKDTFDSRAALRAYHGPVLLGHGRHDRIIGHRHGQELAKVAGSTLVTWDCGHNDCPPDWNAYLDSVTAFLHRHGVLIHDP